MRMLVLGGGQQGSACAYDLLTRTDYEVVLADRSLERVPRFLQSFIGGRLTLRQVDASDDSALGPLFDGAAATMSALPYYFNDRLTAAAIEAGSHFCDLGGNTEVVIRQKAVQERARAAGVSVVPDCGVAPGMVNILAEHGIRQLERPRAVRIKVGGLPQFPEPPLNYQVVYSLEGVIDYYTTRSWILRNGEPTQVEALSELEELDFPGVGRLEAFHTAGGLSTMAQRYRGILETMEYKTLRYPGHAGAMRTMRDLGLMDTEPVQIKDQTVVPRDLFIEVVGARLRKDPQESPDLVVMRVEVDGEQNDEALSLRWDLLDKLDPETGITAMMRTTGYSLAITGIMQVEGKLEAGVWTPDEAVPAEPYIQALRQRGIRIEKSRTTRREA